MTEQYTQRNINLQPAEGLGFYLFNSNSPTQDGIVWNDWESMLNALSTVPGNKEILMDPGAPNGTVTIPVRAGEATSTYNLTGITIRGARPGTVVDIGNVRLDGLENALNCSFINTGSTISNFVVDAAAVRTLEFVGCAFVQDAAALASMFDINGTCFITSDTCDYSASPAALDLFDVDAAGGLSITSLGSNYFGSNPLTSTFGGASPATIQYNADDVYFPAVQTTPATLILISNFDASIGSAPSVASWAVSPPTNITDAINRIANAVAAAHGPIA